MGKKTFVLIVALMTFSLIGIIRYKYIGLIMRLRRKESNLKMMLKLL